jgi:hypothetical protein
MCITIEPCWVYDGKPYLREIEAYRAALTAIAGKIVKDHSTNPLEGLLQHGGDVSRLLARFTELLPADMVGKGTLQTSAGEPKGGQADDPE